MLKKLLASTLALATVFTTLSSSVKAADISRTIYVTEGNYPNIWYYPQVFHVNEGDTLHFTIKNTRQGDTRIFIPAYNQSQIIFKNSLAQLNLSFCNPISKHIWFEISSLNGKKIPGYFVVDNYQPPLSPVCSKPIDPNSLAGLNSIINYSTEVNYPPKDEPVYCAPKKARHTVRGRW